MKKGIIAVVIVLGVLLCSAFLKSGLENDVETFLSTIIKGDVETAYNTLLKGTQLTERTESIQLQKQQTAQLFDAYGKLLSFEQVKKEQYGQSLTRMVYLLKCENMPVIWEFYYYKASKKWQLVSLKFRDNLDYLAIN